MVYPDGDLTPEIAATEKKGKVKIEIDVGWRHGEDAVGT
jgi:hypothetical protein